MKMILEGVTGSRAYGLDTEFSDTDMKGVMVAPTSEVLGLRKPKETIVRTNPDVTYYEVEKFINLALKCNPTVLELLFLDGYTQLTAEGHWLVDSRYKFLSSTVYMTYGGYALSQARRLEQRDAEGKEGFDSAVKNRYAKHARHCFRLLQQGKELLETGDLTVRVDNRDELFEIGELPVKELVARFEAEFEKFNAIKSVLPDKPDFEAINKLLLEIRRVNSVL